MHNLIIAGVLIGLVFLAGSCAAQPIALSAGPQAEGDLIIAEAEAYAMNANTDEEKALAAFKLEEAKKQVAELRESAVNKGVWWNWALKVGGTICILISLIFGAINLQAYFGNKNYRVLISPVSHNDGHGLTTTIPFPLFPFLAIQTWEDAPTVGVLYQPGRAPMLTSHEDAMLMAFARMLRADDVGDQKMGNFNLIISKLKLMLDGIPRRQLPDLAEAVYRE